MLQSCNGYLSRVLYVDVLRYLAVGSDLQGVRSNGSQAIGQGRAARGPQGVRTGELII